MHELESSLPERFNAAAHLLALNAGRGGKTAYIDDAHDLSYANLAERARHFAGALLALGIWREERVLMVTLDSIDFPIAFLGALCAGIVPADTRGDDFAFMEAISIASIEKAREAYATTELKQRLARHHDDPDPAFRGWNDAWLSPAFRHWNIEAEVAAITCPVLAAQGEDDEYGALEQIRAIARHAPQTKLLVIGQCGHSPHCDVPDVLSREAGRLILEPHTA